MNAVDITEAMLRHHIGRIEYYPGGNFVVALVDGSWGQGKSVGEAFANIQRKRRAA
jgi:predicted RNase H-like HicB family nuclease